MSKDTKAKKGPARSVAPIGAVGAQILDDARAKGREARLAGKLRHECPIHSEYPVKGARDAWLSGWDAAAPLSPGPEVSTRPVEVQTRGAVQFWPQGQPFPESYALRAAVPCEPKERGGCGGVNLAGGARAVLVEQTSNGFAFLRCRGCGLKFKRRLA